MPARPGDQYTAGLRELAPEVCCGWYSSPQPVEGVGPDVYFTGYGAVVPVEKVVEAIHRYVEADAPSSSWSGPCARRSRRRSGWRSWAERCCPSSPCRLMRPV